MNVVRFVAVMLIGLVAGCGGSSSPSSQPNASSTVITFTTAAGTIVPGATVTLSTGISSANVPTGVIAQQVTDANGQVTFANLPSSGILCVSATEPLSGGSQFTAQCFQPFPAAYTLI